MKLSAPILFLTIISVSTAFSRDVRGEIKRAETFGKSAGSLLTHNDFRAFWAKDGSRLVYRINTGPGAHRFFEVDLKSGAKAPAFDHEALAKMLTKVAAREVRPDSLPLDPFQPATESGIFRFRAFGKGWSFDAAKQTLIPDDTPPESNELLAPEEIQLRHRQNSGPTSITIENATPGEIEMFWVEGRNERKSFGKIAPGDTCTTSTYSGHVWIMADAHGVPLAGIVAKDTPAFARVTGKVEPKPRKRNDTSPDGKWRAFIRDHNLFVEPAAGGESMALTTDGTAADAYTGPIQWSPDSKKLSAWRAKAVESRKVHIVQSSPPDQIQPKLITLDYPKPGDPIPQRMPRLFDIGSRRQIPVVNTLFNNPWEISDTAWSPDSSEFSFVYNQRGHQVMRIISLRADSGSARVIHEETSRTFIDYSQKSYLRRLPKTRELLWTSERSGYNHLYRIDEASGQIKNPVTQGDWNVREVVEVDEEKQQLLLKVVGISRENPYHAHFVRVNFDGSGFTRLTQSEGNHEIEFSPERRWLLASWSRPDQPPVVELRSAKDGKLLAELERADDSALQKTGWSRPERFVAKGRDGKTDIHGLIMRPKHFDPAKTYPVVEDIYAGPHDQFVPQDFLSWSRQNAMAELGFIVVSIDGMGTNWRSKAFHDVCWKNLADGGFPDRIVWIKAAATTRPWMDLTRVGIYGGSAGGQNALAALLHHGDFYKAGVADCGCHDNRLDKIWWNEAWMGWPVDESYARNSNVTHAAKLTGKLMLIVGELDDNVDPASTAQVVAALEKAGKDFDFVPIMNARHGAAETPYGKYRRAEFLIRHLQAPEPNLQVAPSEGRDEP